MTRYDLIGSEPRGYCSCQIADVCNGDYVRFSDHEDAIEALRDALVELCSAVEHGRSTREPWNKAMAVLGPNAQGQRAAEPSAAPQSSTT